MLFKPESEDGAKIAEVKKPSFLSRVLRRMVSLAVTLVILGGLGNVAQVLPLPGSDRCVSKLARKAHLHFR